MDYVGQREKEGPKMSQVHVVEVDLCDNLPDPDSLNTEHLNLNEAEAFSKTHIPHQTMTQNHLFLNGCEPLQHNRLNGVGQEEGENDEVMKEVEDMDESEESCSLICCQSPDTPMTDSSFSETGSLLETPYPFSPGTSPEPTSPIIPAVSPETTYPVSVLECDAQLVNVGSEASSVEPICCTTQSTLTTGPIDISKMTASAAVPTGTVRPICITQSPVAAGSINSLTGPMTSSTQSVNPHGPDCSQGLVSSYAEITASASDGSTATPATGIMELTTASVGLTSSDAHQITTSSSMAIAASGPTATPEPLPEPLPEPALLLSLEQLGQRAGDAHLPQYLHQIAEAFVLHEDYQRALWCIQLERLYHQRILDNLQTLQEQWESRCRLSAPGLATQLDSLTHICQTHNRPSARDAVCVSLDSLRRSLFDEGRLRGTPSSCTSSHQAKADVEDRTETDSSLSPTQPITSSASLTDSLQTVGAARDGTPAATDRGEGDSKVQEEGGRTGHATPVGAAGIHPHPNREMERSDLMEKEGAESGPLQVEEEEEEEENIEKEGRGAVEAVEALEREEEEVENKEVCEKSLPEEALAIKADTVAQQTPREELCKESLLHQEEAEELCKESLLHQEEAEELCKESLLHQEEAEELCKESLLHQEEEELQEVNQEAPSTQRDEEMEVVCGVKKVDLIRADASLDDLAKLITVEEMSPASGLVSILKKRRVCVDNVCAPTSPAPQPSKPPAKRRVRFKVPDDGYDQEVGSGDSCLLLFLLCFVTVVISVGGTALYCALGDTHSTVCQDFSRNADFYVSQMQHGIAQIQHWFTPGS